MIGSRYIIAVLFPIFCLTCSTLPAPVWVRPSACTRRRPALADQRPGRASAGTWGQRLPIIHMQNKYIILHLYHVLLTKCTARTAAMNFVRSEMILCLLKHNIWRVRLGFLQGVPFTSVFLKDLTIKHPKFKTIRKHIELIFVMYDILTNNLQHLQAKTHVSCTKNDKIPLLLSIHCS